MRERIERERVKPPEAARFHFKLGHGSLADVQFAVELSLMRLRRRGPEESGRGGRWRRSSGCAERRLVEQTVARDLGEAFVFLSDVKNALEVDRRVHAEAVPAAPDEQTALARRLGYEEYPRQSVHRRLPARSRGDVAGRWSACSRRSWRERDGRRTFVPSDGT